LIFVRVEEAGKPINLHFLLDGCILGGHNTHTARNMAIRLLARPEFAREKLAELNQPDFERWVNAESFLLAKEVAYQDGKIPGSPDRDLAPILGIRL